MEFVLAILTLLLSMVSPIAGDGNMTLEGCPTSCGNVSIPYPFGIYGVYGFGGDCYRPGLGLLCDKTNNRLFLAVNGTATEVVTNISVVPPLLMIDVPFLAMSVSLDNHKAKWTALEGGPYTLSPANRFYVLGSESSGVKAYLEDIGTGHIDRTCGFDTYEHKCGVSCYSTSIPPGLKSYGIGIEIYGYSMSKMKAFVSCGYNFSKQDLESDLINGSATVPVSLDWAMRDQISCEETVQNPNWSYGCTSPNSYCVDQTVGALGYHCECSKGYRGNPYMDQGCQDIDECSHPEEYVCNGICSNSIGNYSCVCPPGMQGNPKNENCYPNKKLTTVVLSVIIGLSIGVGLLLLSMTAVFLHRRWQKRCLKMVKEKHFCKNRGLLLQQLISNEDVGERTKIFSLEELEKATNNFDNTRILGRGGHGTVFKGILLDQRVVAIKKSKIAVQREIDQFINEVVILSQLNHRNVVKLFGCCLESEVPLLVYEFVSNGTLSDHIHLGERTSSLSWGDRLRIAKETAGALAYLHSSASISIFHRDVKSSNILLDDNYTAKVSDFGASRSIPLDQTRVVTIVQGTFGYLDPEYYHTCHLTQKSDVYSFGVILVELLTGEKPICFTRAEDERNLSIYFLSLQRDGRLSQIVEARVMEEATREELDSIAKLATMCLNSKGERRPTMKEVETSLGGLARFARQRHEGSEFS